MTAVHGIMDVTLGTDDVARAIRFYDALMAVVGLARLADAPRGWAGWGPVTDTDTDQALPGLWLCKPFDGQPATQGNGTMVTFRATSAAQVRAFHAAALAHGGRDDGPPGTRPAYDPAFYVAYVRDPDGHKLACAHTAFDPREEAHE